MTPPPKKGSLYPTASQTAYKQGGLSLKALQVVRCTRSSPCFHDFQGLIHRFPWLQTQVIPVGKPTSTCTVKGLWCCSQQYPLLFAEGPWTKTGRETKYSLLILRKETGSICGLLFCQNATETTFPEGATWIQSFLFFSDHWENNCFICRDQQSGRSSREICRVCFIFPLEFIRCGQVRSQHQNHEGKMGYSCQQNCTPIVQQAYLIVSKLAKHIIHF